MFPLSYNKIVMVISLTKVLELDCFEKDYKNMIKNESLKMSEKQMKVLGWVALTSCPLLWCASQIMNNLQKRNFIQHQFWPSTDLWVYCSFPRKKISMRQVAFCLVTAIRSFDFSLFCGILKESNKESWRIAVDSELSQIALGVSIK